MNTLIPKYKFEQDRQIGEHKIILPTPPDISKIAYSDLPKEQQFFRRTYLPSDWKFYTTEQRSAFAREEWRKRNEGFWFMNNGQIEYMSPTHYFYCNWWRIDRAEIPKEYILDPRDYNFPFFVDSDRDWHYVMDMAYADENCVGLFSIENRRGGKALSLDTDIPTLDGWKTMGSIKEGDMVFGSNGKPTKVTFVSDVMDNNNCYEVVFSDGSKVVADEEHLWIAYDRVDRWSMRRGKSEEFTKPKVVTTGYMKSKLKYHKSENNWSIKNCDPVLYDKKDLEIPPYILGLWLGDGSRETATITSIDDFIIKEWVSYGESIGLNFKVVGRDKIMYNLVTKESQNGGWVTNNFKNKLRKYNLLKNKHIPDIYLQSSFDDRLELLKGLMDTDGSTYKESSTCEFCSKDEKFILQVHELICSLGYKSRITSKLNKKYNRRYYYLRFSPHGLVPFKLQRKIDRTKKTLKGGWKPNHRYVVAINRVDSVPVRCIAVENEDRSYLCTKSYIVTHNTQRAISYEYEKVSKTKDSQGGIQSRNDTDAKKVFGKIVYGWRNLPPFFKPTDTGEKNPARTIRFDEPRHRDSKNQNKEYSESLHSWIDYENAKEGAYDGQPQLINIQDEIGKISKEEGIDLLERIRVVRECCVKGSTVVGKIIGTTTVEEMEKKGGRQAKDLWDRSTVLDTEACSMPQIYKTKKARDENGFTLSGLYRHFKPSYMGLWGTDTDKTPFIDRYGYSQVDRAKAYLERRRSNKTGADLSSEKRKYPIVVTDCWVSDSKKSVFDTTRIEQQIQHNQSLPDSLLVRGNFMWKDGIKDSIVVWQPMPEGRWLVAWLPKVEDRNKHIVIYGKKRPANTEIGCFGLDPYDHKITVDNRKSDAASYGFRQFDPMSPSESGIFISEYVNRPKLPEILWEDMILQAVFYGWQTHIENNRIGTINYFRMRGYYEYLMDRPEETQKDVVQGKEQEKGTPMTGEEARMALIYATESYIGSKVGLIEEEGKTPYYGKCYFNRLLTDWLDFDFDQKWTKFDCMVGAGFALLGSRKRVLKKTESKPMHLFQKYSNKGMVSKRVDMKNFR